MTAIVILAFAAHVVAWLFLPDRKAVGIEKEPMRVGRAIQAPSM